MRHVHLWLRAHPLVFDGLAAGVVVFFSLVLFTSLASGGHWWQALFPLVFVAPVALRSRHQVGALYATAALGLIALGTFQFPHPAILYAGIVMAYSANAYGPRKHARTALALCVAFGVIGGVKWGYLILELTGTSYSLSELTLPNRILALGLAIGICGAPLVMAWLWGGVVHARHAYLQEALDRASRLESERDALARLAVVEERGRIARELHDVVAHSLSVVVLQADGARHVLETDPQRAAKALEAIGHTGREATAEMRRLLGVLRSGPEAAIPAPQPELGQLDALVSQVRASGLTVTLTVIGDLKTVPAGAGLSAYRIVQEALTNAVKHGGPGVTAEVAAEVRPEGLALSITDDGRGAAAHDDGAGLGLLGMRERAAAVGGEVTAGPRPGGGFRVTAWLPRNATPRPAAPASGPAKTPGTVTS
ncbi:sensor histidine kinase [Cryptosporangium phraense]|uniref:Oxygen sensor histidine kinase NreB n=1 Tax=Cryptosporangium phraense TaxID=2593070 RepID=A0A545AGM0_9ACTN|nr:sensor histidine kinase [Cryptosporangium phraense]TQS40469.1 sensor histidine kinase [Cryptosporangium phraense]